VSDVLDSVSAMRLTSLQLPKPSYLDSFRGDGCVVECGWECIAISIGHGVGMKHLMAVCFWRRGDGWEFFLYYFKKEWT
jgi:hypothetical protein